VGVNRNALCSDISEAASEEGRRVSKILVIQGQAFIMREREGERGGLERVLKRQEKVENSKVRSTVREMKM
jgi:hypothetical protein